jgi:CarD family transcriptional regulator
LRQRASTGESRRRHLRAAPSAGGSNGRKPDSGANGYAVGDRVVYPRHGVGTIRDRGVEEVLERRREYLTIWFPRRRMTLKLPAEQVEPAGLRPVADRHDLERALDALQGRPESLLGNWDSRRKHSRRIIASGHISEIAELIRDLAALASKRALSTSDEDAYTLARELLESELVCTLRLTQEEATQLVDQALGGGAGTPDGPSAA